MQISVFLDALQLCFLRPLKSMLFWKVCVLTRLSLRMVTLDTLFLTRVSVVIRSSDYGRFSPGQINQLTISPV